MNLLQSILTNAVFIGIATLILQHFLSRNLQNDVEKLKSNLQMEQVTAQEMLNKKRAVYIELMESMSVFIGERIPDHELEAYKRKFLNAYDASWLWASDSVIKALSEYMTVKINSTTEDEEKVAFKNLVIEMRKDLGFSSEITSDNYKFITF